MSIPTSLALIVFEFLNWYGTKIRLCHCARDIHGGSIRCFVNILLEDFTGKAPSQILAKQFPLKLGFYVNHEVFVPNEELRRFSNPCISILFHSQSSSHNRYWLKSLELSLSSEEEALELPQNFNAIWNRFKVQ